jgi:tetratricopeptide (TPR) repeat protein
MTRSLTLSVLTAGLLSSSLGFAQPQMTLPEASPKASVSQVVGLTNVTIRYGRPAVNKRKVWGGLVPYGEVWRAGANENTTFEVSSPVKIEGRPLSAGTYGLHVIPTETTWTVIFSEQSHAWGSFSYDKKEDALRVEVKPAPAEHVERLQYTIDEPTGDAATVSLHWEKVRGSFKVEVDTPAVTVESLRRELRGLARFSWQGWSQAAGYCARNKVNLDEALSWADQSIGLNENYQNLRIKAALLEAKGDKPGAEALRAKAAPLATEADVNNQGYALLGQGKSDDAIEVFRKNVKDYPKSWNAVDSLAEALAAKGDKKGSVELYRKALSMAPESQKKRIEGEIAKHSK